LVRLRRCDCVRGHGRSRRSLHTLNAGRPLLSQRSGASRHVAGADRATCQKQSYPRVPVPWKHGITSSADHRNLAAVALCFARSVSYFSLSAADLHQEREISLIIEQSATPIPAHQDPPLTSVSVVPPWRWHAAHLARLDYRFSWMAHARKLVSARSAWVAS